MPTKISFRFVQPRLCCVRGSFPFMYFSSPHYKKIMLSNYIDKKWGTCKTYVMRSLSFGENRRRSWHYSLNNVVFNAVSIVMYMYSNARQVADGLRRVDTVRSVHREDSFQWNLWTWCMFQNCMPSSQSAFRWSWMIDQVSPEKEIVEQRSIR